MNVSVSKPSGEFIARLEIERIEDIPEKVQELHSSGARIPLRSRVEAGGKCWGIAGFNPIQLREETPRAVRSSAAAPVIETQWRKHSSRRSGRSQMMAGLAWCIGGVVVTVVSYMAAAGGPGGSSYIVAWGAILFGGIRFLKGLASSRDR
ncbi:MAG TPA: hypothetical protein VK961_24080 [Chthoniobacter sp.]|nr:hypothetical protein [Chthoniobacter sp.]